jgi:hypothetical protein
LEREKSPARFFFFSFASVNPPADENLREGRDKENNQNEFHSEVVYDEMKKKGFV